MQLKIVCAFVLINLSILLSACNSSTTTPASHAIPEPDSVGGKLLKKYCNDCHGAPRVASHKADEWPNIVLRMQTHRIKKAYNALSETEIRDLVAYLQKHAAK